MSENTKPHAYNPPGVPIPHKNSYSQVCTIPLLPGISLITLAGLTGVDETNPHATPQPATVGAQATLAYQWIKTCLASAGATPRDIVQVKHYIVQKTGDEEVDRLDVVERGWAEKWMEFMDKEAGGHRPPDTVVGVACLATKKLMYECEVWAIVRK